MGNLHIIFWQFSIVISSDTFQLQTVDAFWKSTKVFCMSLPMLIVSTILKLHLFTILANISVDCRHENLWNEFLFTLN